MQLPELSATGFAETFDCRLTIVWEPDLSVTMTGKRGGLNILVPGDKCGLLWLCVRGSWDGTYFARSGERDIRQVGRDEAEWRLSAARLPDFVALVAGWDLDRDVWSIGLARVFAPEPHRSGLKAHQVRSLVLATLS